MNDQLVNMKLVGEVEKHAILYNFTLPGYSKKDETERAWGEVAKEVNMSAVECKERWKNIRAVFVRNMKPIKYGSGGKVKKAYYLLEAMQFTVPYIKALGGLSGNLHNPPQPEEEAEQFEQIYYEYSATDEPEIPSPSQERTFSPSSISPTPEPPREPIKTTTEMSQTQSQSSRTTRNKRALKIDIVDLQAKKAKSSPSDHANQISKIKGLKMFLLSVLPDLLKMSDEQVRQFKREVLDVVDDILSTRTMNSP